MIIKSLLDTDLYKLTMQYAILSKYPNVRATYGFINRRKSDVLTEGMLKLIREEVEKITTLKAFPAEVEYLMRRCPYFPSWYEGWLLNFRPDPGHVKFDGDQITVEGPWAEAIWWEVPLLAIISEVYCAAQDYKDGYKVVDMLKEVNDTTEKKVIALSDAGCKVIEMGTRRRRGLWAQDSILHTMQDCHGLGHRAIIGTSNVSLAYRHALKPMGTMAHEWIMGVSALESLRHANRHALRMWDEVFSSKCNTALTDTFGTDAFFKDFDTTLTRVYDATRQDSGDPIKYGEKVIAHYQNMGIDPTTKTVVFSDGLDVDGCIKLQRQFGGFINIVYGMGTHFTNDFKDRKAMNIVIKLTSVDGIPVCKLSDVAGKASGDPNAVKAAKYVFLGEPLV